MAYYPDLSRYAYAASGGDGPELCVGWIERGHDFARGDVPAGFVDALLRCATRPVRLMRGFHACDLCPPVATHEYRVTSMPLDGREIRLGNGEIRVRAADGASYTAPTLVAHYVADHRYLPPAEFVNAVLRRAAAWYVLEGAQLERLTALPLEDQLDLCIRVIAALPTRAPAALAAVCASLRLRNDAALHEADDADELSDEIAEACSMVADVFSRTDQERRARGRACLIYTLELASDLGVDATAY